MCGECCRKYYVPINEETAVRLVRKYGRETVIKRGRKYYLAKIRDQCIFLRNNICLIQNDKPLACKLWPFYVSNKPRKRENKDFALYTYRGREFYVYVDTFCKGLNRGINPIENIVKEVIQLYLQEKIKQCLTTSEVRERTIYTYAPTNVRFSTVIIRPKFLNKDALGHIGIYSLIKRVKRTSIFEQQNSDVNLNENRYSFRRRQP